MTERPKMNQRFGELKKQAHEYAVDQEWYIDSFEQKFAELIVRECVESLWTEECYTSDLALKEFLKNSKKINLHFGVEE